MNLNNFHKHVSQKIYERGEEYYENDTIDNVEHDYAKAIQRRTLFIFFVLTAKRLPVPDEPFGIEEDIFQLQLYL